MTDDNLFLSGNFAPVEDESSAFDLPVTGTLPPELEGRLLRIGPNPIEVDPASYHWFLGNGMVHGVRLGGGRAHWYRNRFVRDDVVVAHRGGPPVPGPRPEWTLAGGLANTNVIGHAGRVYAIVEGGNLPVELDDELATRARSDFGGTLASGFSAHPKRDPATGELHAAVYSPVLEGIQYVVVGTDGRVRKHVDVPVPGKPMVHDCSITERHFVLLDLPVVLDTEAGEGSALPYAWRPDYGARVGLLPFDGDADDVVWHEVEPCYVFHPVNSYENADGRIVLDVVRHPSTFSREPGGPPTLDRWTLDPRDGSLREERLDDRPQEFPRIDERRIGREHRYAYTSWIGDGFSFPGLLKHDLRDGKTELHREGPARQFMEPVFVPRSDDAAEDDGWILSYVHDDSTGTADVVVLHAQDFASGPVATVHLPARVPFGFHGNWLPDSA